MSQLFWETYSRTIYREQTAVKDRGKDVSSVYPVTELVFKMTQLELL